MTPPDPDFDQAPDTEHAPPPVRAPRSDWERYIYDLVARDAELRITMEHAQEYHRRLEALLTRQAEATEGQERAARALAEVERQRLAWEQQREQQREDRWWGWWTRACKAGREALGSPQLQPLVAALVGAAVTAIGWAVASWGQPRGGP